MTMLKIGREGKDMVILSELSLVVKRQKSKMGLSQERLGVLASLSRATINELETDKPANLSLTRAERLANVLGYGLGVTGILKLNQMNNLAAR